MTREEAIKHFNDNGFIRDVKGYEGLYKVNALGEIYSVKSNKYLSLYPDRQGYLKLCLFKNGKAKQFKVHRLVAEAFLGKRPANMQTNHIDEDKTNNCVWNLEYITPSKNVNHGTRNMRVANALINNNFFSKPIKMCNTNGMILAEFPSIAEASRQTKISQSNISRALRKKRNTAGGYIWIEKGEENE